MRKIGLFLIGLCMSAAASAQNFNDYFADKTLRLDYIFTGNATRQEICLDELCSLPGWAGRKHHLDELPLEGNGQVVVKDQQSGKAIYKTSFSSLFQEWLETDEAQQTVKGFENTFLIPYPLRPIEVEITLFDLRRNVQAKLKHIVNPDDILIHHKGQSHITPPQISAAKRQRRTVH